MLLLLVLEEEEVAGVETDGVFGAESVFLGSVDGIAITLGPVGVVQVVLLLVAILLFDEKSLKAACR